MTNGTCEDNQVSFLASPIYVWWDVTNRCNFNCLHCYSRSGLQNPGPDELKTDEAKKLISELSEIGVFYIYFLGGEPFIRPDFMDLVAFARSNNVEVMINTNGWFITKSIAERLKEFDVRQVRVSLDGACADTHDYFRGKQGAFSRAIAAIENLNEAGIDRVGVVPTITRHNIHEVDQLLDLAADLGIHELQCVPLCSSGRGADNFGDMGLTPGDNLQLREILERKRTQYQGKMIVHSVEGVLETPCTLCVHKGRVRPDFMGCRAGRASCNIDYNGNVIPCLLIREPVAGNIRLHTFKEIWDNSPVFMKWRRKRLDFPECRDCEWNDVCIRECPASPSQQELTSELRKNRIQDLKNEWQKVQKGCQIGVCRM